MFYVFDMDIGDNENRLQQVAGFFKLLNPPKQLTLVLLFVTSHYAAENVIHEFYASIPHLDFEHLVVSKEARSTLALKRGLSTMLREAIRKRRRMSGNLLWDCSEGLQEEVQTNLNSHLREETMAEEDMMHVME